MPINTVAIVHIIIKILCYNYVGCTAFAFHTKQFLFLHPLSITVVLAIILFIMFRSIVMA